MAMARAVLMLFAALVLLLVVALPTGAQDGAVAEPEPEVEGEPEPEVEPEPEDMYADGLMDCVDNCTTNTTDVFAEGDVAVDALPEAVTSAVDAALNSGGITIDGSSEWTIASAEFEDDDGGYFELEMASPEGSEVEVKVTAEGVILEIDA